MHALLPTVLLLSSLLMGGWGSTGEPAGDADALLHKLHDSGRDIRTLSGSVRMLDYDFDTGEETVRPGTVALRRPSDAAPAAAYVVFTGRQSGQGGSFTPEVIEYLLSDGMLVDRNHRARTQVTRPLPDARRDADPLALGDGPFPLPVGQDPAEVRELFEVSTYDPHDADANDLEIDPVAGSGRLRLVPRPGTRFDGQFSRVEVDVDFTRGLPTQVATLDAAGVRLRIVTLPDLAVDADVTADAFRLRDVDLSDWNVSEEALEPSEPRS